MTNIKNSLDEYIDSLCDLLDDFNDYADFERQNRSDILRYKQNRKGNLSDLLDQDFLQTSDLEDEQQVFERIVEEKEKLEHSLWCAISPRNPFPSSVMLSRANLNLLLFNTLKKSNGRSYSQSEEEAVEFLKENTKPSPSFSDEQLASAVEFFGSAEVAMDICTVSQDSEFVSLLPEQTRKLCQLTANRQLTPEKNTEVFQELYDCFRSSCKTKGEEVHSEKTFQKTN